MVFGSWCVGMVPKFVIQDRPKDKFEEGPNPLQITRRHVNLIHKKLYPCLLASHCWMV